MSTNLVDKKYLESKLNEIQISNINNNEYKLLSNDNNIS